MPLLYGIRGIPLIDGFCTRGECRRSRKRQAVLTTLPVRPNWRQLELLSLLEDSLVKAPVPDFPHGLFSLVWLGLCPFSAKAATRFGRILARSCSCLAMSGRDGNLTALKKLFF